MEVLILFFEDEGVTVPLNEQERFDHLPEEYSHLYLAIGGELAAVICISDPLRSEAKEVLTALRALGIEKTVMLTGDTIRDKLDGQKGKSPDLQLRSQSAC